MFKVSHILRVDDAKYRKQYNIVLIEQYYGNNHYHVAMVLGIQINEYGDFSSCSIFM